MKYKIFLQVLIILISLFINIKSQQNYNNYNNIYVNYNISNSNGDGTITNPFQSLCDINSNILTSNSIINIAVGEYNTKKCIFEINNINNFTIIPYNPNNNNDNLINIYNIGFNIINSTIININDLNFIFLNDNFKININNSINIIINNSIIENYIILIYNSNNVVFKNSLVKSTSNMVTTINQIINSVDSNLVVNDTVFQSSNSNIMLLKSSSISKATGVSFNNIFISEFKIQESTIVLESLIPTESVFLSGLYEFNNITFYKSISTTLITLLTNNNNNNNLIMNQINLIDNNNILFLKLNIKNNSFNSISIRNFNFVKTITATKCDINRFVTTSSTSSNISSNLTISDSIFNCFGTSEFKFSNVQFRNVSITTTFKGAFIRILEDALVTFYSSTFKTSNFDTKGSLFVLDNGSFLTLNQCIIKDSSSTLLVSSSQKEASVIKINNCQFLRSTSNTSPFILTLNSNLSISNSLFEHYNSSLSSFITAFSTKIKIESTQLNNFLIGSQTPMISALNSNFEIDDLRMDNCICGFNTFFSVARPQIFSISNSIFTNNHGIERDFQLFSFWNGTNITFSHPQFIGNSFSPMIYLESSNFTISDITYYNNTGSFVSGISNQTQTVEISNFLIENNKTPFEYLFAFRGPYSARLYRITIANNYLPKYLIYFGSQERSNPKNSIEITCFNYYNNIIIDNFNGNNIFPFLFDIETPVPSQILFYNIDSKFTNSIVENNKFLYGVFTVSQANFEISYSSLSNNQFQSNGLGKLFSIYGVSFYNVYTTFYQVTINNNRIAQDLTYSILFDEPLVKIFSTSINISNCEMSFNYFPRSKGGAINKDDVSRWYQVIIKDSIFDSNIAQYGGAISLAGYYENKDLQISNCVFKNNYAKDNGGAIYIEYSTFIGTNNSFYNNSCLFGKNNYGSGPFLLSPHYLKAVSGEVLFVQFSILDYSLEIINGISGFLNTSITQFRCNKKVYKNSCVPNDLITNVTYVSSKVVSGQGSFYYVFYGDFPTWYNIKLVGYPVSLFINIEPTGCPPYTIDQNNNFMNCTFCPFGSSAIKVGNKSECFQCNSQEMVCQNSNVYSLDGYYKVKTNKVFSCAIDMCSQENTCQSSLHTGDTCYYCLEGVAKNGIQCCSKFNPILLLPVFTMFFLISLILSVLKFKNNHSILKSTIIFIQTNSIIFFSYGGIYILPLFRFSIDFLDQYCYFKNLNYLHKLIISNIVIIISFILSSTNITINLINNLIINNYYFKKTIYKISTNKKRLDNDNNNQADNIIEQFEKYNRKITQRNYSIIHKTKSTWFLIQIYSIPVLFNLISVLIYREQYYIPTSRESNNEFHDSSSHQIDANDIERNILLLALDFSVPYLNYSNTPLHPLHLILFLISTISLFLILLFLLLIVLMVLNHYKLIRNGWYFWLYNRIIPDKLKIIKRVISKLNYTKKFKWWDLLVLAKSFIYTLLALLMLFKPQLYMNIVLWIQIAYSVCFFLANPIQSKNNYQRRHEQRRNNLINLYQIFIFILSGSLLFKTLIPQLKGIVITILTLLIFLFL
ncbi:hypothetical protein DICPUDRAFT_76333 [Dictyostelium purpureum]|uniref:Right handed beta helix domain-containing protein n=1 Tax=Dictyostelium purpureum TaxID=5786 RepID=F0ZDA8_DICPU|nr:uncharacterized protein DICPUDRAFT_76333 [Dictyostelium purpureum]EGC38075.1 hypothetical protein DICPUDRAFT_76333 [Dictyostelium purpureum]|eukprot:XP_003285382.1 hypothetical protein DICPUDRAFT_76333 [Dictyostelium purpureum]